MRMRYFDELPRPAQVAFRNAVGAVRSDEPQPRDTFACLGLKGFDLLVHYADLFERVAYELHKLEGDGPGVVARLLFGVESANEVIGFAAEIFDEVEYAAKGRQDRIVRRIADGTHSAADVAWIQAQADAASDELLLETRPFDGDQSEATELSRKVVRGRVPHTCHWTRRTIAPGERHVVIKEVVDWEFLTTRHSVLAAYLDVAGEDPGLASHLAPRTEVAA
jgi:hypothetical protein